MATILIVEDRPIDRKLLGRILRDGGHEVLEASDGEHAMRVVADFHPELVISDILMPTVDGYELVRRLREAPDVASTKVIFYTATYHEHEARALAQKCGVFAILTKPSPTTRILAVVEAALALSSEDVAVVSDRGSFDQEHVQLVNRALADRIERSDADRDRLTAVARVAADIALERNPQALLQRVCEEARRITLARQAVLGLLATGGTETKAVVTSGFDDETASNLTLPSVQGSVIGPVVTRRRSVRRRNPQGRPDMLGLPADHPPVSSLLSVPVATTSHVYGWISLRNKLGAEEFTAADEHAAVTLGLHAGASYESAHLIETLQRRVAVVGRRLRRTLVRARRTRNDERASLARTVHDELGQLVVGLKMDLHQVLEQLPSVSNGATDVRPRVEAIVRSVEEVLRGVRRIASELRPGALEDVSLIGAIRREAANFERRFAIGCPVEALSENPPLDRYRTTLVVRIVREALSNVARHAAATQVTISLRIWRTALTVSIADNGRGVTTGEMRVPRSLGLIGMHERAALLGGRLQVRRRRPAGTAVTLTVPLFEGRSRPLS
jgi:signal transduction histidine kinase